MPSDLETYLAAVEEEDDVARAAQVHVPTLVEIVRRIEQAINDHGHCGHRTMMDVDRIARAAMEK